MKSEKGITLTALIIYVLVFTATLGLLANLSNFVYSNLSKINTNSVSSEEFNKFNSYFVQDIKECKQGTATTIEQNGEKTVEIVLSNGSKYTYKQSENAIYRGNVKIARTIAEFEADNFEENGKKIIRIKISTGTNKEKPNFGKTIKYVLRYW